MTIPKRFLRDQRASAAIEYGLIGALVSIAIITGLLQLSAAIGGKFDFVATAISDVLK
ncbi:Flp family type IVb pilin [Brucella endophytica]|uniref:Flp family type IVb pilin n=1 Tax=Brucella endophytica TaxID=1963359 RepID=UPI00166D4F14|nr:Flp family type IVb pilin [Brucella endophytica]